MTHDYPALAASVHEAWRVLYNVEQTIEVDSGFPDSLLELAQRASAAADALHDALKGQG